MPQTETDRMANRVSPDQTVPVGAVYLDCYSFLRTTCDNFIEIYGNEYKQMCSYSASCYGPG